MTRIVDQTDELEPTCGHEACCASGNTPEAPLLHTMRRELKFLCGH